MKSAFLGTLILSLGLSTELKNGKKIETSLVHEHSLEKNGQ